MNYTQNPRSASRTIDKDELKTHCQGREQEVFRVIGLPDDLRREQPCPKRCGEGGGKSRFYYHKGMPFCRHCFKGGDVLAVVMWFTGRSFKEALQLVAEVTGFVAADKTLRSVDSSPIETICRLKSMPLASFLKYGAAKSTYGREKHIVCCVPTWDREGKPTGRFYIGHAFGANADLRSKLLKGVNKKGSSAGLFLPERTPRPGEKWILVEGVKDAAALDSLGYCAAGLPTTAMNAQFAHLFAGCDVVLLPDLDEPSFEGSKKTARRLVGIAQSVSVARLPGELVKSKGADVRDVLKQDNGRRLVKQTIADAREWRSDGVDSKPTVVVSDDEAAVTRTVIDGLSTLGWNSPWISGAEQSEVQVFQRQGKLVQVTSEPIPTTVGITTPESLPRIVEIPKSIVRERIGQSCNLVVERTVRDGSTAQAPVKPHPWMVNAIHERGQYPDAIKSLAAIIHAPTLRADGTVLQEPGYDERTRILYLPNDEFPSVPEQPTKGEAISAAELLLDLVVDFPFLNDSHRSGWLSMLLTMIARPAINGACPLFVMDANVRGSGKSKLVDLACIIAFGMTSSRSALPTDESEVRKRITAIVSAGIPSVLFDNVDIKIGGPSIEAALTGTVWEDRKLGHTEMVRMPITQVWTATGNNVGFKGDAGRRTQICRLESPEENPEDRTGFRHPNIEKYVSANRAKLAVAALTLVRAYLASGCKVSLNEPWGSYESWCDVIRASIVWTGFADPCGTKQQTREQDDSAESFQLVHQAFAEIDPNSEGKSATEILELYFQKTGNFEEAKYVNNTLRAAMSQVIDGQVNPRTIGAALKLFKGRVRHGKKLEQKKSNGTRYWCLVPSGASGISGASDSQPREFKSHVVTEYYEAQKYGGLETNVPDVPNAPASEDQPSVEYYREFV